MKKMMFVVSVAFAALSLASCEKIKGEGPVISETRAVSGYHRISISLGGTVNYRVAAGFGVEIQAQQNVADAIETKVVGGELRIGLKPGKRLGSHDPLVINVDAPLIDFVDLSGSATVNLQGVLNVTDFGTRISGSGKIQAAEVIAANKISASISGSGGVKLVLGSCVNQDIDVSGSGNVDLAAVTSTHADVSISGSGNVWVQPSGTLDASISGSGSVYYHGNPAITQHISGSGAVRSF